MHTSVRTSTPIEGITYTADAEGNAAGPIQDDPNWKHDPPTGWRKGQIEEAYSLASRISAVDRKRLVEEREAKSKPIDEDLRVLRAAPPASQAHRIEAALRILRVYRVGEREGDWATAIRELIAIGKPAVPRLIEELDRTESDKTLRAMGFVLRGIGDPRAVPALIRAIPRLIQPSSSDFGLTIKNDPELLKFMWMNDLDHFGNTKGVRESNGLILFSYERSIREIMSALEKLTRQSHGWRQLNFAAAKADGVIQLRRQRTLFLDHAKLWADWWSHHWKDFVPEEADAQLAQTKKSLDQFAETIAKMPQPALPTEIPCGPHVRIDGGESWRQFEPYLNLDTRRQPSDPGELLKNSPKDRPSPELLAWAGREGVDLLRIEIRRPGDSKTYYGYQPVGMKVWKIDNKRLKTLDKELQRAKKLDLPPLWKGPISSVDRPTGDIDEEEPASFLFITRGGTCGTLQIRSALVHEFVPGAAVMGSSLLEYRYIFEGEPAPARSAAADRPASPQPEEKGLPLEQVVGRIKELGGEITVDEQLADKPVIGVHFKSIRVIDADLAILKNLPHLRSLRMGGRQLTDAGLAHLQNLTQLEELTIRQTRVTGAGLAHLKGLVRLKKLDIGCNNIGNAGLANLKGMARLEQLNLIATEITDAGLEHLQNLTQLRWLNLSHNKISGTGLAHLKGLSHLQDLELGDTHDLTEPGWKHLNELAQIRHASIAADRGAVRILEVAATKAEPALVRGRVLYHDGTPAARASVFLVGNDVSTTIGDGKAWQGIREDMTEDKTVPKATTDAAGRFTLPGGGDAKRIVVSAPRLDFWVVPAPKNAAKDSEFAIKLPAPGRLVVKYDIPGGDAKAKLFLQVNTWDWPISRGIQCTAGPLVANKGQVVLDDLPPGKCYLDREKNIAWGTYFCDRRLLTIESGKTLESNFIRERGTAVIGQVIGLKKEMRASVSGAANSAGVLVSVRSPEAKDGILSDLGLPLFDVLKCGQDGRFKTEQLLPGKYAMIAEAWLPEKPEEMQSSGIRRSSFIGRAVVTVPERGPPLQVTVELKPRENTPPAKSGKEGKGAPSGPPKSS